MRTDGEKNSKNFLHLEKRNFLRKKISKLKLSIGEETDDAETILEEEKTCYKNLYSTRNGNPNDSEFDVFFNNNLLTPLNEEQSKKCEGVLTEHECYQRIYTSCLFQPAHSSYDRYSLSSKNYEPHAFCRKHLWCFFHI